MESKELLSSNSFLSWVHASQTIVHSHYYSQINDYKLKKNKLKSLEIKKKMFNLILNQHYGRKCLLLRGILIIETEKQIKNTRDFHHSNVR